MFWYEDEVKRLEKIRPATQKEPPTLFYGSSSMRLWGSLTGDFPSAHPVNLGFGGSTLAACVWFFDRVMAPYQPGALVIYAGDNDLGDGRHPEEIYLFFKQLVLSVNEKFGEIPCFFISIKPSVSRWNIIDALKYTNNLIESEIVKMDNNWRFVNIFPKMLDKNGYPDKQYFESDGLHLSPAGYELWKSMLTPLLSKLYTGLTYR